MTYSLPELAPGVADDYSLNRSFQVGNPVCTELRCHYGVEMSRSYRE